MVQAVKGYLVECDVPTKEFLINLNDSLPPSDNFIFCELDDTRLFIKPKRVEFVRQRLKAFYEQHTYQAPQAQTRH